jgi:hypothetical protein
MLTPFRWRGLTAASVTNATGVAAEYQCSLLYFSPGTIPCLARVPFGDEQIRREVPVRSKQINPTSASVMADVYLGVAVTGLYTLVGMGLIIVFM